MADFISSLIGFTPYSRKKDKSKGKGHAKVLKRIKRQSEYILLVILYSNTI